jgi:hypothetical protein
MRAFTRKEDFDYARDLELQDAGHPLIRPNIIHSITLYAGFAKSGAPK